MPLKEGPNGTWRKYSSLNGRYVKMSPEEVLFTLSSKKAKSLTKEEKREKRSTYLRDRASQSKDPGLFEIFDFIESRIPHYVQYVNQDIYIPSERKSRETDIIGKNAIIEIKMGRSGKKLKQILAQNEVAKKRSLKMILYAPNMPYNARHQFEKHGIVVIRNKESLYQEIKNERN